MKHDERARILENVEIAPGFHRLAMHAPAVVRDFAPGQFVQVRIDPDASAPLLRRPFAPSRAAPDGRLEIVFALVGDGTRRLAAKQPGEVVGVLGPLGRGYTAPAAPTAPAVLVGGGYGAPNLRPWLTALKAEGRRVGVVVGARDGRGLLELDAWRAANPDDLLPATDDGSVGFHGHAVAAAASLLDRPDYAHADADSAPTLYGCGPHPMLAGLARLAAERGLACQVSLEERMACGFGACVGCVVEVKTEDDQTTYEKVCQDGPVFDATHIAWNR